MIFVMKFAIGVVANEAANDFCFMKYEALLSVRLLKLYPNIDLIKLG